MKFLKLFCTIKQINVYLKYQSQLSQNFLLPKISYRSITNYYPSNVKEITKYRRGYHWKEKFVNSDLFSKKILTPKQWDEEIKSEINKCAFNLTNEMLEVEIMSNSTAINNYELVNSYMSYRNSQKNDEKLHFLSLTCYLQLLSNNRCNFSESKFREVYEMLRNEIDLPSIIHLKMIQCLLNSSLNNSDDIEYHLLQMTNESNFRAQAYNVITIATLRDHGFEKAIDCLKYCIDKKVSISDNTIRSFIKPLNIMSNEEKVDSIHSLCYNLKNTDKEIGIKLAKQIIEICGKSMNTKILRILSKEKCTNCGTKLEELELSKKDIAHLRDSCEKNVIRKTDVYLTSTPEEWNNFTRFLNRFGPFEQVVDGLNTFIGDREERVYNPGWLAKQKKKTLVIGRKHIDKNFRKLFRGKGIPSNFYRYYVENITKDDGFVLYAALHSGLGCKVYSGDLFRQHINVFVGDLKKKFGIWQILYQKCDIDVITYQRQIQWNEKNRTWHIPIVEEVKEFKHSTVLRVHDNWLCLSFPQ